MKNIITERQYKILSEQPAGLGTVGGYDWQKPEAIKKGVEMTGVDPHTILMVAAIGSSFIPVIGPLVAGGIGMADAALYYKEGDTKTAGMVAMFSLLPGLGSVVAKIPFIKQLGAKGMTALAAKLSKGGKNLSKLETQAVKGISDNLPLIKQELNTQVKNLASQASAKPVATNVKNSLLNLGKKGLTWSGKNVAPYAVAGAGYEYAWNKYNPNPTINFNNIDTKNISQENQKAAKELQF
jgi:hypothetical protein